MRVLRVALPVAIALILGTTILAIWLDPLRLLVRLPGDPGKLVISGTKITMQAPRLTGYTHDQRAYDVTANGATQDVTKPNIVAETPACAAGGAAPAHRRRRARRGLGNPQCASGSGG